MLGKFCESYGEELSVWIHIWETRLDDNVKDTVEEERAGAFQGSTA